MSCNNVGPEMAGHYLNRKGYYSLNVQIVCDANCKILNSIHDARIWNTCQLKTRLEISKSEHNGILLGDAGYPNSTILLTPLRNPSTPKEQRYNKSHIATRSRIECLNGQLKSKFRSILQRLRVDLNTAKNIVVAVAVLHKIAKERNFMYLDTDSTTYISSNTSEEIEVPPSNAGRAFRSAFINTYF